MPKPITLAVLIDDVEIDQRQYVRVLNRSGLVQKVMTFTYADTALEYLVQHPELDIDVIFLDINMPRMNGFEFLVAASERLGPNFAKIVVAMLTTSLNPNDERRADSFGMVKSFINKPLTVEDVQHVADLLRPPETRLSA